MWGNVAMQNPAAADLHDEQHVQDLETSRDRDQKVAGDDRLSVIVNKGPPMLRRSSPWTLAAGVLRPVGTYCASRKPQSVGKDGNYTSFIILSSDAHFSCDTLCHSVCDLAFACWAGGGVP